MNEDKPPMSTFFFFAHGVVARDQHREPLYQQADDDQQYAAEQEYREIVHNFWLFRFRCAQFRDHPGGETVAGARAPDNRT